MQTIKNKIFIWIFYEFQHILYRNHISFSWIIHSEVFFKGLKLIDKILLFRGYVISCVDIHVVLFNTNLRQLISL